MLLFSWFQKIPSWRLRPCSSDIIMGLAVGPLICFSAICSVECRGAAQTATFLLSLGLCNRSLFLSFLQNYACSRFPYFSKSHSSVCGHLIVNCCFTYYILLLVLGIISTVGNLRPFVSDLIEEWTIGTLLLYKLRVPLLLLFWIVASGDCWSACLLLTEPVITLLVSAAESCFISILQNYFLLVVLELFSSCCFGGYSSCWRLQPFASDLIAELAIGTLHSSKQRVPLLFLLWQLVLLFCDW